MSDRVIVERLTFALARGEELEVDGELFTQVTDFPRYMIGDRGSVFSSVRKGRFLQWFYGSQRGPNDGYAVVALMPDGASHPIKKYIHRLVASEFIENPFNHSTINHKNGIKIDNNYLNLEWCSYSENQRHALETGLNKSFGEMHYAAKLTDDDVRKIRVEASEGIYHRVIAEKYGMTRRAIGDIINRRHWRHVS